MLTHNLRAELTSFIGRDDELREIELLAGQRRLVTLTGIGGCGKTRLAGQVCDRLGGRWEDGAWWFDLGSISDPDLVVRSVASALGALIEPKGDPLQALAAQLRTRRLLLCFDTCEHLLDAVASLTDTLLRACPDVSVLATSREPLGVAGETVWRVPSLKVDEAVRLFTDRALLVAPGFTAGRHQVEVRSVCRRVDGIPLAIELAAAWVRALAPMQIVSGLDESFRLLEGGPRGALPRHQALTASMEWSHALLDADEQRVFRRLAGFAGSFSLDAVRDVCVDDDTGDADVLAIVGRLVDKSLVVVREGEAETRYRLLDTVRQYAEDRLRDAAEIGVVRDRHLEHYLRLAERAEPELDRDQDPWREALEREHDNLHAALEWGLSADSDASRGRRLAAALARQWFVRGQAHEGLDFLDRALARVPDDRSRLQARLLSGRAMLGMVSGRIPMAAESAELGGAIAAENGDDRTHARCLALSAYQDFYFDMERCRQRATEASELAAAAGDEFARDWGQVQAAYSLTTRDRHAEAAALAQAAYQRSEPRGDRFVAAFARGVEFYAALYTGEVRRAADISDHLMAIVEPIGDYFAVGTNTTNVALGRAMSGDIAGGRRAMETIVRSVDDRPDTDVVGFQVVLGFLALWDGALDEAVGWFERGTRFTGPGAADNWTAARCMPGLAEALARLGRADEATDVAERALALARRFEAAYPHSHALDVQAMLATGSDPARARSLHHDALAVRRRSGLRTFYVDSLDALAGLSAEDGSRSEAARILAASDAGRDAMGYPRPPVGLAAHESVLASLRSGLGDEFEAAWADGAALSLDDAVSVATRGRGPQNRPSTGWASLTPAELDVVRLVVEGLTNPDIGGRLFISRATVKTHLSHIYAKLDVANRTELATMASGRLDRGEPA